MGRRALDKATRDEVVTAAREAAAAEIRERRYRRWLTEVVLVLAVVAGLWFYQDSQDEQDLQIARDLAADTSEVARQLAAQGEVARYEQDRTSVLAARDSCERVNAGLRAPLYDFLLSAEAARRAAGTPTDVRAADEYAAQAEAMIQAGADTLRRPDRPEVACVRAFPMPLKPSPATRELAKVAPTPTPP